MRRRCFKTLLVGIGSWLLLSSPWALAQDVAGNTDPRLSVSDLSMVGSGEGSRITGNVTNASDATCPYVYVLFTLFDGDDQLVGNTYDSVENLQPGNSWAFSCPVTNPKVVRWRLDKMTCSQMPPVPEQPVPIPGGQ
jgi:hypothetical protein